MEEYDSAQLDRPILLDQISYTEWYAILEDALGGCSCRCAGGHTCTALHQHDPAGVRGRVYAARCQTGENC